MATKRAVLQKKVSTPIPKGSVIVGNTAEYTVNGVKVIIHTDEWNDFEVDPGSDAQTNFVFYTEWQNLENYQFDQATGRVTVYKPTGKLHCKIKTYYLSTVNKGAQSGYGRGTTRTDRKKKRTSLGFHEGRHGLDYLRYIKRNTPPKFVYKKKKIHKSKLEAEITSQIAEYTKAIVAYSAKMEKYSLHRTDCVGKPMNDSVCKVKHKHSHKH